MAVSWNWIFKYCYYVKNFQCSYILEIFCSYYVVIQSVTRLTNFCQHVFLSRVFPPFLMRAKLRVSTAVIPSLRASAAAKSRLEYNSSDSGLKIAPVFNAQGNQGSMEVVQCTDAKLLYPPQWPHCYLSRPAVTCMGSEDKAEFSVYLYGEGVFDFAWQSLPIFRIVLFFLTSIWYLLWF
jgi:hypothetical protein